MFSVADFGRMIGDRARIDAHAAALRRVVTPASIVVDIGAGTGVMSLLACQAGARRVYAIEPSAAVEILAAAARDNGFADRIVVLQRRSTDVTLPDRANVIVSDLRGVLPPYGSHFADIADARRRLLAPEGWLLPARDTLRLAVISNADAFERRHGVWRDGLEGLELGSALPFVDNEMEKQQARREQLLCEPVSWADLDYATLTSRAVRGAGDCAITTPGIAHGLLVWFDTELVPGIGYSNAPGGPEGIYGQIFFIWPRAVPLQAGDRVSVEVRADPVGSDYVWTWATEIHRRGADAAPSARFRQCTFNSMPLSREALRRREPTFVPTLSEAGQAALEVLAGMRAGRPLAELARQLLAAHGDRFASLDDAHGFAAELAERFGR